MDWFEIWYKDKQGIIDTMVKNMAADLKAGHDYFGKGIKGKMEEIEAYKTKFDEELMSFADMDDKKRNRWCYYDLLRRGAITL